MSVRVFYFYFLILSALSRAGYAEEKSGGLAPTSLFADATLVSNAVDKGLTQSMGDPALQATVGYRWVYFKVGVWGSNVHYAERDAHLNLRYFGSYQFVWTSNADMTVRYDYSNYYPSEARNGTIASVNINLFGYGIIYEQNSNWEGHGDSATYFGVKRSWPLPYSLNWDNQVGYSMLSASGYNSYIDIRTAASYLLAKVTYSLGLTMVSDSSQLADQGAMFIILGLTAAL